jgi:hypothetical protein
MIISSTIKVCRTIEENRTTLNTMYLFFDSDDIQENIKIVAPEATISVSSVQGLCIVSDNVFSVSGDITLTENTKVLFIGSELDIDITNPSEVDDLNITIYTW